MIHRQSIGFKAKLLVGLWIGQNLSKCVPNPYPASLTDEPAAATELAARHEGHREDVAQPAARHLGRPLTLVRDIHVAPAPLPGNISDPPFKYPFKYLQANISLLRIEH